MKIIVTSDLHIEFDSQDALSAMSDVIASERPDVFIIAGDLAHSPAGFERVLETFQNVPGKKAVLVGNHDLWCKLIESRPRSTSRELMSDVFPTMARDHGWLWLEDDEIRLGDASFVS